MIKSTKFSLKFSNKNKSIELENFYNEYLKITQLFVNILWNKEEIKNYIDKEITSIISKNTWLSARAIQASGKQASGIVRGTKTKMQRRLFILEKLIKEGKLKKARKLKKIIEENPITKPELKNVNPQLDKRFIKIDLDNKTSFDGWITISSIGNNKKIKLPFKKTSHFNKLISNNWILNSSVRVNKKYICLSLEKENLKKNNNEKIIGIDIGIKSVYSISNGIQSEKDKDGWDLDLIQKKLSKKKKGSKNYKKTQEHRKNYINWTINQLDLNNVSKVKLENIKNLRKGKKNSSYLSRWTYTEIFNKLEDKCSLSGVQIEYINPTYTSQRCSRCGWTRKKNRNGILFKCEKCGFTSNSDLNASINISLDLPVISKKKRLMNPNKLGFFWDVIKQGTYSSSCQKV